CHLVTAVAVTHLRVPGLALATSKYSPNLQLQSLSSQQFRSLFSRSTPGTMYVSSPEDSSLVLSTTPTCKAWCMPALISAGYIKVQMAEATGRRCSTG